MKHHTTSKPPQTLHSFAQIRRLLPSSVDGRTLAPSTLSRWRTTGVRGVRLRCQRIGGRWFVRQTDLDEFLRALNEREGPEELAGDAQAGGEGSAHA